MSINATTTSVSNTASSSQVSAGVNSDMSQKTSAESSFKDEMEKVSSKEKTDENNSVQKNEENKSKDVEDSGVINESGVEGTDKVDSELSQQVNVVEGEVEYNKFASMAMIDMNKQLSSDIEKMVNGTSALNPAMNGLVSGAKDAKLSGMMSLDYTNNLSMTESDAEFFVNLTQKNDVTAQNMVAQAQNMLSNGVEASQVKQNVQISQALLNAINAAKENNQPLRIDFDQNVSVILRVGKDGALAANFIPGDKAVEQYLRNNIEALKNTFKENDLPYTDLSYSNRGGKQQKEQRRNKQG